MKNRAFFLFFVSCILLESPSIAAVSSLNDAGTAIRPISQYGIIQNVQDYSTNPFWTKNSPYNQKFPQPVYVTGPELTTADCQSTVGALVSSYCAANKDCVGMQLSDVRPVIMLQLSRMPGHNYASSCSGYIDTEFDAYVERYSVAVPNGAVAFPGATVANPNYDAPEFKIENPYEKKDWTWNGEEWQKEKKERSKELEDLQSQNGAGNEHLVRAEFPTTFSDLSFAERMDVKTAGYEPFKDASAFQQIKLAQEPNSVAGTNNVYGESANMASLIQKISAALKNAKK
ncbi:MAG: hypothetical protein J5679_02450 [Alphaproteobacteria bacterium]|nr:hypothetical protein [Alphaproteobacteria bacterium]